MTEQCRDLAHLLRQERARIVDRFVAELRRLEIAPRGASWSLLVDHIPDFLEEIIAEARKRAPPAADSEAMEVSVTARQHGGQRWQLGYDLGALIREYEILQSCILATAKEAGLPLAVDDFCVLAKCTSTGVAEAVTQYTKHRDG